MRKLRLAGSIGIGVWISILAGNVHAQTQLDGEIYLDHVPDHSATAGEHTTGHNYLPPYGDWQMFQFDPPRDHTKATIYQREVARWKDPTTLPHSRSECVKYASGHVPLDGNWKTCVGWKTQFQWLYVTAWLRVQTANQDDVEAAVNDCLRTSAVASALSGIISGGSAALSTFSSVMQACLVSKLPDLVSVQAFTTTAWGGWE